MLATPAVGKTYDYHSSDNPNIIQSQAVAAVAGGNSSSSIGSSRPSAAAAGRPTGRSPSPSLGGGALQGLSEEPSLSASQMDAVSGAGPYARRPPPGRASQESVFDNPTVNLRSGGLQSDEYEAGPPRPAAAPAARQSRQSVQSDEYYAPPRPAAAPMAAAHQSHQSVQSAASLGQQGGMRAVSFGVSGGELEDDVDPYGSYAAPGADEDY